MANLLMRWHYVERAYAHDVNVRKEQRRRIRDDIKPFSISNEEFVATYRLPKTVVRNLTEELVPYIPGCTRRSDISVESKVLTALAFFASGSYQRVVGQNALNCMAQQTVSRVIKQVTMALNQRDITKKYIHFPQSVQERTEIKRRFYEKYNIPGVIGCIDGTHVSLVRPSNNEEWYYNRKQRHSINAQIICDADLTILNVDARYGGASHDSFIWANHPINQKLTTLYNGGETMWLLGDSGYAQRTTMMTPIVDAAAGSPQENYTHMQTTARNTVERCIGVLKSRWRCLLAQRVLYYEPMVVANIINACTVLHNIANRERLPVELFPEQHEHEARVLRGIRAAGDIHPINQELAAGRAAREELVQRLWEERRNR